MGFLPFKALGALHVLASPLPCSDSPASYLWACRIRPSALLHHPKLPELWVLPARPLPALVRVSLLPPGVQAPLLRSRSSASSRAHPRITVPGLATCFTYGLWCGENPL